MRARGLLWLAPLLLASCRESDSGPSAFLAGFDPGGLVSESREFFEQVDSVGRRTGVVISPPGHRFHGFRIEGRIRPARLRDLESVLESRMPAAVEAANHRDLPGEGGPAAASPRRGSAAQHGLAAIL